MPARKGLLAPQNTFLDTIATRFDGTREFIHLLQIKNISSIKSIFQEIAWIWDHFYKKYIKNIYICVSEQNSKNVCIVIKNDENSTFNWLKTFNLLNLIFNNNFALIYMISTNF